MSDLRINPFLAFFAAASLASALAISACYSVEDTQTPISGPSDTGANFNPEGVWNLTLGSDTSVTTTYSNGTPPKTGNASSSSVGNPVLTVPNLMNIGYQPDSSQTSLWFGAGLPLLASLDASHSATPVFYKGGALFGGLTPGYWCIRDETISLQVSFDDSDHATIHLIDQYSFQSSGPNGKNCDPGYLNSVQAQLPSQPAGDALPWKGYNDANALDLSNLTSIDTIAVTYTIQGVRASPTLGLPGHCTDSAALTHLPVDPQWIYRIEPLGHLKPEDGSHVFPGNRTYFYLGLNGVQQQVKNVPLYAASTGTVSHVAAFVRSDNSVQYQLTLIPCQEMTIQYDHVLSLSPALMDYLKQRFSFDPASCPSSNTGMPCLSQNTNFAVTDPTQIGTVGTNDNLKAFDFMANDLRTKLNYIHPDNRFFDDQHVTCALDYYPSSLKSQAYSFLPAAHPTCGRVDEDGAPNSAQGYWYNYAFPGMPDQSPHMVLVPDNLDSSVQAFSIGSHVPGFPNSALLRFKPSQDPVKIANHINQPFSSITNDPIGTVYCFEFKDMALNNVPNVTQNTVFIRFVKPYDGVGLEIAPGSSSTCPTPAPAPQVMPGVGTVFYR